jgi:hypothetical protein
MAPDFTFKPDTRISKYYYQRLEARDPAYQHKTMMVPPNNHLSSPEAAPPPRYGSVGRATRAASHNGRRQLSGNGRLHEKERLTRSLKKSATLTNDLFEPDLAYHPRVGRGPRNQVRPRGPRGKATALMLYHQSKALQKKMDERKRYYEEQYERQNRKVHTIERSRAIIEELKIKHFQAIFRRLDSDQDGAISSQRIDITWLPS